MKKLLSLLLAFVLVLSLAACGGTGTTSAPTDTSPSASAVSSEPTSSADASSTVKFTDSAGRAVDVPAKITRIAASGSLAQIVLFSLAPDMLVGVAGKWSASAQPFIDQKYYDLPVIGQFYGQGDLNLEEVAKLAPQIIIDVGEPKDTIAEDMDGIQEQVGIPTVHITAATDSMAAAYRTLGRLLGLEDKAEALAQYCETVDKRTHEIADAMGDKKTSLVYCLGDNGLNVIAKGSFHAEVVDLLANNAAVVDSPSSKGSGNPVDMEQLLNWNPDVILFAPGSVYDTVGSDATWQQLSAVKNGKYYEVPEGPYNWLGMPPSVNRYMGMIWLAQLLYPDTAKYNLYDETAKFYDLFYHAKLTEDQFKTLTENALAK
ncbi:iron complex transport system substrate-binding protein [Sporobacter termitidis DSM 10068]|uniref:Iron complex transport system substrate-binding protein n=1 Tax=Sporobacter termitidis DSM 10068 TaxID=1123282 RepID=A0A1M5Z509_9FIRM|nr:ABC transporter substrate-binding protein [Sporobacter termitidis]SHI19290.1 iron complex transport system substrate-binding protein [Sporobacter termitidis DSM 10068]